VLSHDIHGERVVQSIANRQVEGVVIIIKTVMKRVVKNTLPKARWKE
jgi:hypothetical protein